MSNTIAVVIAVIGILALFVAAGALFAVVRKAGNRTIPGNQEAAAGRGPVSPELAADAERRAAEAGRAAELRLEEASRAADQMRASAESDAAGIVRRAEESANKVMQAQRAAEEHVLATKTEAGRLRADLERREARLAEREGRLDLDTPRGHLQVRARQAELVHVAWLHGTRLAHRLINRLPVHRRGLRLQVSGRWSGCCVGGAARHGEHAECDEQVRAERAGWT